MLILTLVLSGQVQELGRCPVDSVIRIEAGSFISPDSFQVLVVEQAGVLNLCRSGNSTDLSGPVPVFRLALLRMNGPGFQVCWRSGLLLGSQAVAYNLLPEAWASGDFDGDSLAEIVIFSGGYLQVLNFDQRVVRVESVPAAGGMILDACGADLDGNGIQELVTLELEVDSAGRHQLVRIRGLGFSGEERQGLAVVLPDSEPGMKFFLLGSARLEDYPGSPVLIVGEYPALKPSRYYLLYQAKADSFVLTNTPFPWQEWFVRTEVLAAGRLNLFNIGDTLVAWGYFVPGVGSSSGLSFAALQDGEWRVLKPRPEGTKISGSWCRFNTAWLNLRQGRFYLYPEPPFFWR